MKLMHLSDLHLGKRVNEYSMMEDQSDILQKILHIADEEKPDGVIIAGDVYDKPVPPAEAVELFDEFLVKLAKRHLQVFVISGNHDSPERIAFGGRLMDQSGIHLSPVYGGAIKPITLNDAFGPLNIYLLPFIKPAHVRRFYPDREIATYTEAMSLVLEEMQIDKTQRNLLVTHQFVTGALRTESEELSVGGSDNVDASVFDDFDYVALGHIHRSQKCGRETVRYSGTPLKYSFSEARDQKSVTMVELLEKGRVQLSFIPLKPMRDLVELRGSFQQLTDKAFYAQTTYDEDYVHITLTDEEDIPEVMTKLRPIYHHIMKLDYDNRRTRFEAEIDGASDVEKKTPFEQFESLYELLNGQPFSEDQALYVQKIIEEIWGDEQ